MKKQKKSKEEFVWRLLVIYSGGGGLHNPRNNDKEMILLDREPTARDLKRFDSEYTFRECCHTYDGLILRGSRPDGPDYCGWRKFEIRRGDDKRKHDVRVPCYRAEVRRLDLSDLGERCIDLEGQKFAVWRDEIPVPVYRSLDEYFNKPKKE